MGGWTSRCCGCGSGRRIGEKRVDEEVLWLFIACFLIIVFEKFVYRGWKVDIINIEMLVAIWRIGNVTSWCGLCSVWKGYLMGNFAICKKKTVELL